MKMNNSQTLPLRREQIELLTLKSNFITKFPNSPITQTLLNLPDTMDAEELIGAVAVLLDLLDRERNNNIGGGI
ncbi:hypothetical protein CPM_0574 [Cuniculiplasma divulgatum]|jgi:hypothetical protein|uniref:Uncharacterized protein n=1 Tax=Cuniculiplasma divulgatum TaxID=1673428 RepID=A0A1R4A674_9ARCH|nr:hypothetical protein CPM_0574 [Cuniculiplasma divulgatum]